MDKPAPTCFVCLPADLKHFLGDCEKFKPYTPSSKRQIVIDAKRCLHCLSLEHFLREGPYPSKCRKCGPSSQNEHTGALHESYQAGSHEAAKGEVVKSPSNANDDINVEGRDLNVLKINSVENGVVLMRTSAVKTVNPATGKSSLVYAQHDTASQATLISETLKAELGLRATPDPTVSFRTLANEKVSSVGRTYFQLESLNSGEQFHINGAVVVPQFSDDKNTLPHAIDTNTLEHFEGEHVPVVLDRRRC